MSWGLNRIGDMGSLESLVWFGAIESDENGLPWVLVNKKVGCNET